MTQSGQVFFSKAQVKYLMEKLDIDDPHKAVEKFAECCKLEKIDPMKMEVYLDRLMEKDEA
jgi:hypothetical protein